MVRRKLLVRSVSNCWAFPSADCGSDNQLVMANIKLKLKAKKTVERLKKVNIKKFKEEDVK